MDAPQAICLRCGSPKRAGADTCRVCHFVPHGDDESLVRSVYLSADRFDDPETQYRYTKDLRTLGTRIQAGESIEFDTSELSRLRAQYRDVQAVSGSTLVGAMVRLFFPALLFIAGLFVVYFGLRALHR